MNTILYCHLLAILAVSATVPITPPTKIIYIVIGILVAMISRTISKL